MPSTQSASLTVERAARSNSGFRVSLHLLDRTSRQTARRQKRLEPTVDDLVDLLLARRDGRDLLGLRHVEGLRNSGSETGGGLTFDPEPDDQDRGSLRLPVAHVTSMDDTRQRSVTASARPQCRSSTIWGEGASPS